MGGIPKAPTYSTAVRAIAACPASVRVPAATTTVTPSASGATVVLRSGDAVSFAPAAGARIGLTGATATDESTILCRSGDASRVVLVGRATGYVRVGVVAKSGATPALLFVKVTP